MKEEVIDDDEKKMINSFYKHKKCYETRIKEEYFFKKEYFYICTYIYKYLQMKTK